MKTTELLALKDSGSYYRFTEEGREKCSMAKASVYPMEQAELVKELLSRLHADGYHQADIVKLTITEEPYQPS